MTDQEIMQSIAGGRSAAFELLYERYSARGCGLAMSLVKNRSQAEEIVQSAFCKLLDAAVAGKLVIDQRGFGPIFFRTIRNLVIDDYRKSKPVMSLGTSDAEQVESHYATEQPLIDLQATINQLIEELPDAWREALRLRIDGRLNYEQIASAMNCTRQQVRTWIYRARLKLHHRLQQTESQHVPASKAGEHNSR